MNRIGFFILLNLLAANNLLAEQHSICPDCEYESLEELWPMVSDWDTIMIKLGTYPMENFQIDKPIYLIGEKDAILVSKSGDEILTIIADSVQIKGLGFKNVTTSYLKERSAIRIARKKGFVIENNQIIDCFFGIYLEKAHDGLVKDNTLKGNASIIEADSGNGIHAWHCKNLEIVNNVISGHRDGIYFEFVNNSKIYDNVSTENNRYGLHFMFSNDDAYYNNKFENNGVGVAVMFSRRIEMYNNSFALNWGRASYGLLLKEIYDGEISNNEFHQNTIGIFVEGSNRINYFNNSFRKNGWAIKFSGGCEDNKVENNNFIHNSLDLIINSKLSSNSFSKNYWSAYSGYDLDKDGIGDIPHYPVKLFSYILDQTPEAIIMMRSLFVDLINFSEKVSPVFTPKEVMDKLPLMKPVL